MGCTSQGCSKDYTCYLCKALRTQCYKKKVLTKYEQRSFCHVFGEHGGIQGWWVEEEASSAAERLEGLR